MRQYLLLLLLQLPAVIGLLPVTPVVVGAFGNRPLHPTSGTHGYAGDSSRGEPVALPLVRLSAARVLVLDPVSTAGVSALEERGFETDVREGLTDTELAEVLDSYDALIVRSANQVTRGMMQRARRIACIGRAGTGVDNIDLEAAAELGIPVVNSPTGNSAAVAELVLGLMLSVARRIPAAHQSIAKGEWAKKSLSATGQSLAGKTLAIIGLGSIGCHVAMLAKAFGMNVIALASSSPSPSGKPTKAESLGLEVETLSSLPALLKRADFLSLHVPLTGRTCGLIGDDELRMMPRGAVVINAARGGVVDEEALLACLEGTGEGGGGHLGGAALDVYCKESAPLEDHIVRLAALPNVVLTPHLGASTQQAGDLVLTEVCEAVGRALEGTLPRDKVVSPNPSSSLMCCVAKLRGK